MATLLHSESRRMYSWWWSSHISPKNSKWLQENLTDMDVKVKAMIKLIEEDADSFARRAEMYYKRRPELMKLVEEFYRAYRALAERYNHATKELRQAHRTMAEAFPDQVPYSLTDESPSSNSSAPDTEPHTPEIQHAIRAFLDSDDLHSAKKGLRQVHDMFESKEAAEESNKSESEIQILKDILAQIQADKESILTEYQKNLEKLASLKGELDHAQQDAKGLDERASKAEIEIKVLKEALLKLEAERDAWLLKFNQSLEIISKLEAKLSLVEKNKEGFNERAVKAETECQYLKQELSRLEPEKEAGLVQYRQCLETISALESRISLAELDARKISDKAEKAEGRIKELEEAVAKSNEEKEAVAFLYKQCLEALAKMEAELSHAQDEAKRLNSQILEDAAKLKNAEEQCSTLERAKQNLQSEAEKLAQRVAVKDSELSRKNEELEKFKTSIHGEQLRFDQVDSSLETLQKLQHQSQEEQRTLALEIRSGLQMLRDLESRKDGLEEEIRLVKEENRSLIELNLSTSVSEETLRHELSNLKEMKEKLEGDFAFQTAKSKVLQDEMCQVREEIKGVSSSYEALLSQVESTGLDPVKLLPSVKELQDENSKLRISLEKDTEEKQSLNEKLKRMDSISEKNAAFEKSLSELNGALHESREMVKQLQESCQSLQGEKSALVAEKAALLSQLLSFTENMQQLVEKNTSLESSLSAGKAEVEGLREKSKRVDEFCQMLIDEKSNLLNERSGIVLHLGNVEQRLTSLETRFTNLEEKCSRLEKEKEATLCQVEELRGFLGSEKQERAAYVQSSESRLSGLENHVNLLQEEIHLRKKDFEEEVEKAVNSQLEIFILQRFVEDLEEKNLSLLFECQKQVESSKLSNKLISELEGENLEQQVELEMLSDEIGKLRTEIYQVFKALQIDPQMWYRDEVAKEPIGLHHKRSPLLHILEKIEQLKSSLSRNKDENMKLSIENSMLFTVLEQLRSEGAELDSSKKLIEEELDFMVVECTMLEKERDELLEVNKQLKFHVAEVERQQEAILEENTEMHEENQSLKEKIVVMEEEKKILGEENDEILKEAMSLGNLSVVFLSFGADKAQELKKVAEDLHNVNNNLKEEIGDLGEQLQMKREENMCLVESVEKLYGELHEEKDLNDQLNHQIIMGNDFLREKAKELVEVEQKLERSRCSSVQLCRTVQELKRDHEESKLCRDIVENQIQTLCEETKDKDEEIEKLVEENRNLELQVQRLHEEVEEGLIREENLCSELQERSNEFELWEAEASSFYFDLQISAVNEVLLENKVHELTEICETLKGSSTSKGEEIEQMKVRVGFLESEIGELKSQLCSYLPIISSLRDDMPSLKQNALLWRQHCADSKPEKDEDIFGDEVCERHEQLGQGKTTVIEEVMDLQKLHCRVEAVEKAVMEEKGRLKMQRDEGKEEESAYDVNCDEKLPRKLLVTKDIPLDHVSNSSFSGRSRRTVRAKYHMLSPEADYMLRKQSSKPMADEEKEELQVEKELAIEDKLEISSSRELEKEVNKRKVLERLSSDAQKLYGLQVNLQDIKKKAEMKKKKMGTNGKNIKLEGLKMQLQDLQETVVQLLIINDHLRKDLDGKHRPSMDENSVAEEEVEEEDIESVRQWKVREQAKRESEKIGRLQFEVQDIQYVLLKMEDEKKMKAGMSKGVMLRDFIRGSRRGSGRKMKKGCFCGCSRVSTKDE